MKHVKVTLTFDYTVDSNTAEIQAARSLTGRLAEYNTDRSHELFEGVDGKHTLVVHDGTYGKKFDFEDLKQFVERYAKSYPGALTSAMNDYAQYIGCSAIVEEDGDA